MPDLGGIKFVEMINQNRDQGTRDLPDIHDRCTVGKKGDGTGNNGLCQEADPKGDIAVEG